ncbi:hypothetical protein [Halobacillus sp. BAB-2008]|uniref:hypothetical protein n=1 Tax=Halobacillus sp. BAB-2008 TaxID=1246484 RepID=UPI0002A51DF7|nr:hypothetical protein [Halobacillus sp. BAB-2008]ELK46654.1 hypothetical protein D479_09726 [Halobacillus sp. BAB-2008]
MTQLAPSMRPKLKKGTFYMPESEDIMYFRNNNGSFRMEGVSITTWIDKLVPMYTGEHTLKSLMEGLPEAYAQRIHDITSTLFHNGFLRDTASDKSHHLPVHAAKKFGSQLEYLETRADSPGWHMEQWRRKRVLILAEGRKATTLTTALLQSGLTSIHVHMTEKNQKEFSKMKELGTREAANDPDINLQISFSQTGSWKKFIHDVDAVLFAGAAQEREKCESIYKFCCEHETPFFALIDLGRKAMAGPVIHSEDGGWTSIWKHLPADWVSDNSPPFSGVTDGLLAHSLVFEWFKHEAGINEPYHSNYFYILDKETLEGDWHSCKPLPRMMHSKIMRKTPTTRTETKDLLLYFQSLAESPLGIFHYWEEGDAEQLPLSRCTIQVKSAGSDFPALLPAVNVAALTHEEARCEAGLAGIERYLHSMQSQGEQMSIGAGGSIHEASLRAVHYWLQKQTFRKRGEYLVFDDVSDPECRYYLRALQMVRPEMEWILSESEAGFPVIWQKSKRGAWHGCSGANLTLAIREAGKLALCEDIRPPKGTYEQITAASTISVNIPSIHEEKVLIDQVNQSLEKNGKKLEFVEVHASPFTEDGVVAVCGVVEKEEKT